LLGAGFVGAGGGGGGVGLVAQPAKMPIATTAKAKLQRFRFSIKAEKNSVPKRTWQRIRAALPLALHLGHPFFARQAVRSQISKFSLRMVSIWLTGDTLMSSQSRIDLYKEAMSLEHERASLQGKLDKLQARLNNINGALFSTGGATAAPAAPISARAVATKAAPAGKKVRSARGALKQRILEALAAAGKTGIRVRDLAVTIGSKPEALHSWFQFARKKIRAIRKAGKGRYRLVGAVPAAAPAAAPAAPKAKAAAKPARASKRGSGQKRGQLSVAVQAALQAAGKDGVRVGELAKKIGVNPRNLFVWFATTGKKFKAIKKVSPGHYCLQS
jgi:transposase-like protein